MGTVGAAVGVLARDRDLRLGVELLRPGQRRAPAEELLRVQIEGVALACHVMVLTFFYEMAVYLMREAFCFLILHCDCGVWVVLLVIKRLAHGVTQSVLLI